MEKLADHLCSQIEHVAGEIFVGHLCTKYRYTQISKANCERGNWPTTCAVKSCRWLGWEIIPRHLRTKYQYTQISQADCEWGNLPTTSAVISGRWLGKSCLEN
ncbi:unnamed protein product [Prunus armeniaca]